MKNLCQAHRGILVHSTLHVKVSSLTPDLVTLSLTSTPSSRRALPSFLRMNSCSTPVPWTTLPNWNELAVRVARCAAGPGRSETGAGRSESRSSIARASVVLHPDIASARRRVGQAGPGRSCGPPGVRDRRKSTAAYCAGAQGLGAALMCFWKLLDRVCRGGCNLRATAKNRDLPRGARLSRRGRARNAMGITKLVTLSSRCGRGGGGRHWPESRVHQWVLAGKAIGRTSPGVQLSGVYLTGEHTQSTGACRQQAEIA